MSAEQIQLPNLPFASKQLLPNLAQHPPKNLREAFAPFQAYESQLRSIFAQQPNHAAVSDPHVNLVPVFEGHQAALKTFARDPAAQTQEENDSYILPLADSHRRKDGSPAVVSSIDDFKRNFGIFSESSLAELDWSNVIAAGSSVVTSLLPVPDQYDSKRGRRKYYHEVIAPASDIDLFLYGLNEQQALAKIKQIESCIKDSQLKEVTTVRTKNTITIVSGYPTRHVQIVLRLYKSVSEILTGFDVDCSCAAFDGKQVYASPRALLSYMTQVNTIDITRRSPSYENRLFKYHKRGFEIHWPHLDRSRIDPTIFERSFVRVQGLARLLVLEQVPDPAERQEYADERRQQRGRPAPPPLFARFAGHRKPKVCKGWKSDIKQNALGEGPDGVEGSALSSYHTFTVPYGPRYNAKNTEKLLYTQDLLLNATWNKPFDREVDLHRHPAFFGNFEDVANDCCGCCPIPNTHEEKKIAEDESKTFISGKMTFLKDDPGRQAIGSFHPLTNDDWTAMAYAGETAKLCEAILSDNLDHVRKWCEDENNDVDRRDSAGRTPLHLAVMTSTPRIVQCLIDNGARIIARLVDGRTALHLAAFRDGEVGREIVRSLLTKSEANREEHTAKVEADKLKGGGSTKPETRSRIRSSEREDEDEDKDDDDEDDDDDDDDDEDEDEDEEGVVVSAPSEGPAMSTASNISVVNVDKADEKHGESDDGEDNLDDPDIYDVDVPAWDQHASALHLAIVSGNAAVAEELVQNFGANLTLPVIIPDHYDAEAKKIILPLVLTSRMMSGKAEDMIKLLLELGATSAQADRLHITALHRFASSKFVKGVQTLLEEDKPAAQQALNYIAISTRRYWAKSAASPLVSAAAASDIEAVKMLLQHGAKAHITFEDFIPHLLQVDKSALRESSSHNKGIMYSSFEQPVIRAAQDENVELINLLLEQGVDVNTLTNETAKAIEDAEMNNQRRYGVNTNNSLQTLLDVVQYSIRAYENYDANYGANQNVAKPLALPPAASRLAGLEQGTFKHWRIQRDVRESQAAYDNALKTFDEQTATDACPEHRQAMDERKTQLQQLESRLIERGAKGFYELHPDREKPPPNVNAQQNSRFSGHDCKVTSEYKLPDLNDTVKAGYDQLFEAAWSGDIELIKSLCLRNWGPKEDQQPLIASTEETQGLNPFAVAVLRGHTDCAAAILQVVEAQYEPPEKDEPKKVLYDIGGGDDDDDSDGASSNENDDEGKLRIYERLVDETYTTDILSGLARRVKSHKTPWSVAITSLQRSAFDSFPFAGIAAESQTDAISNEQTDARNSCFILDHVIRANKISLFKKLYALQSHYLPIFDPTGVDIYLATALKHGRVEVMRELISQHAAGLPLADLIGKKGADEDEDASKGYPGLTVHGRKIKKWAQQRSYYSSGRLWRAGSSKFSLLPPLMHAAGHLNLSALEFFLSDEVLDLYFAAVQKLPFEDIKTLLSMPDAKGVIASWLSSKSELALHYTARMTDHKQLFTPSAEQTKMAELILGRFPASLEAREPQHRATPLLTAFAYWNYDVAKLLIEAGADQFARDVFGRNILHVLLGGITRNQHNAGQVIPVAWLRDFLALLDPALVPQLLTQRASGDHVSEEFLSLTPLAALLRSRMHHVNPARDADVIEALALAGPDALDMLDGAGDTPLHVCVRNSRYQFVVRILRHRPDLLARENGTGRTPLDIARDLALNVVFAGPPLVTGFDGADSNRYGMYFGGVQNNRGSLVQLRPADFLADKKRREEASREGERGPVWTTYDVCAREAANAEAENRGVKRRVVSLFEANAVSERLAKRAVKKRKQRVELEESWRRQREDGEEEERVREVVVNVFEPKFQLC